MIRLIRRPRPDFTTAIATRKAITTSILALANPANAFPARSSGQDHVATASSVDVRRGYAPIRTDAIAEANTANRCQAAAVSPAGTGASQIATASANGNACFRIVRGRVTVEPRLRRVCIGPCRASPLTGLARFHLRFPEGIAREFVSAVCALVTAAAANRGPQNVVAGAGVAAKLAIDLIACIVCPDRAAEQSCSAIVKHDSFDPNPSAGREEP